MKFPLAPSTPTRLGFEPAALERLMELVTRHVAEGRYPGAQLALARHGKLALTRTLGDARLDPKRVAAKDDTLWLLYSNTKVLTACAVWILADRGALSFTDTVAAHVPGFEANGKGETTIIQLLTHQAGFPSAEVPPQVWDDHELLGRTVCGFSLEWAPGSSSIAMECPSRCTSFRLTPPSTPPPTCWRRGAWRMTWGSTRFSSAIIPPGRLTRGFTLRRWPSPPDTSAWA